MKKSQGKPSPSKRKSEEVEIITLDARDVRAFECPLCLETLSSPIYQCTRGHIFCESCEQKTTKCPTCQLCLSKKLKIRNLAMEDLVTKVELECPNGIHGCVVRCRSAEMRAHLENRCHHVEKNLCHLLGLKNCNALCKFVTWPTHLKDNHGDEVAVVASPEILMEQNPPASGTVLETKYKLLGILAYDGMFVVTTHLELESGAMYMSWKVKSLGVEHPENFYYEMELFAGVEPADEKYPIVMHKGKIQDVRDGREGTMYQLTVPVFKLNKISRQNKGLKFRLLVSVKKWDPALQTRRGSKEIPIVHCGVLPVPKPKSNSIMQPVIRLTRTGSGSQPSPGPRAANGSRASSAPRAGNGSQPSSAARSARANPVLALPAPPSPAPSPLRVQPSPRTRRASAAALRASHNAR